MTTNQSAKAKLFTTYWRQKVYMMPDWESFNDDRPVEVDYAYLVKESHYLKNGYLQLRSIAGLTDEEKRIIADMSYYGSHDLNIVDQLFEKYLKKQTILSGEQWWFIQDHLRSVGIALPVTVLEDGKPVTYSVEQQVEMGFIKLK